MSNKRMIGFQFIHDVLGDSDGNVGYLDDYILDFVIKYVCDEHNLTEDEIEWRTYFTTYEHVPGIKFEWRTKGDWPPDEESPSGARLSWTSRHEEGEQPET